MVDRPDQLFLDERADHVDGGEEDVELDLPLASLAIASAIVLKVVTVTLALVLLAKSLTTAWLM